MQTEPLSAQFRLALMDELALAFGRPVDLVDLAIVGEPLPGQILVRGIKILGTEAAYGDLLYRYIVDSTDFLPYRGSHTRGKEAAMDRALIEQKLESLRHCLDRLRARCLVDASTLAADIDAQDIIALSLTRAVQLSVDIGVRDLK